MNPVSSKMQNFMERASWIRKMFEEGAKLKARYGEDKVCDFSLGNPDISPPVGFRKAIERIAASLPQGAHAYMPNQGHLFVREKMALIAGKDHGVNLGAHEIIKTCGAAGGLNIIFKSILNPGEEVIVPSPYFVEYFFYVDNHGGKLVPVRTKEDFSLDIEAIKAAINTNTKAVLINSPTNPTGAIYPEEDIKALAHLLKEASMQMGHPVFLVSDEPYRRLAFNGVRVPPILKHYENSMVATSFSKDLSIPGERIGYVAINPGATHKDALVGALVLANRILGFVNAPAFMQRVVAEAADESVDVGIYQRRRDRLAGILTQAGYEFVLPKGAFYFFPNAPIADDVAFVRILQEERILTVPGSGFGCPGHFRIAFCVDEEVIKRSEDGFKRAMENIRS
jgi:aspartate aminotransferase